MSTQSISLGESQHQKLDELSRQFLEQWRKNESPDIEDYAEANPELACEIRTLFPAIILAEQLNPKEASRSNAFRPQQRMRLGPFHLEREIGRGGMGIVYEATQAPFSQRFAIKVLKPRLISSTTLEMRFMREAEAASRLHHPSIVPAKYYGSEAEQNFLVMPMIDGVSLDKLINAEDGVDPQIYLLFEDICKDWRRLAALIAKIASALSHAHQNGMIHRDIKPANLILARDGNIWITDFGLAKLYDDENDLSRTGELIGTPRYMAPEQLFGAADERSDIYGVGLTVYEMLTHECPWRNRKPEDIERNLSASKKVVTNKKSSMILNIPDICELNPSVPEQLARVIMKACAHHPEERYQSAREFELDLNELCYQGISDRRNSPRSRSIANRYQARNVALALGVAFIGVLFGFILEPSRSYPPPLQSNTLPETLPSHCLVYDLPGTDLINVVTKINSRTDDAEEYDEGEMYLDSRDLELTWDETDQVVGLRFVGVEIEPGTEIHSAKLCFTALRTDRLPTDLRIHGIDDSNPPTFSPSAFNVSGRKRIEPCVEWKPSEWTRNEYYETPECKEIVQQIINKPDWKSKNAIGFIIDGKGNRTAVAFDGYFHDAPKLIIQYRKRSVSNSQ